MTMTRTAERTSSRQQPARRKSPAPRRPPEGRSSHSGGRLKLPVLGTVDLPPRDLLVYLGGLAALSVVGIIEWPITAVIGVGHLLAAERGSRALRDLGEAMEQA